MAWTRVASMKYSAGSPSSAVATRTFSARRSPWASWAENVLVAPADDGEPALYFIDATRVQAIEDAKAYDLACALAALAPRIDASPAVDAALSQYSTESLLAAREFLDFVNLRPDHRFEAAAVKGEIERAAV